MELLGAITEVWLKAVGAFLGPNRGCRRLGGNGGVARKTLGIPIFHFHQTKFWVKPFVWAGYLIWASYPHEGFPPLSCGCGYRYGKPQQTRIWIGNRYPLADTDAITSKRSFGAASLCWLHAGQILPEMSYYILQMIYIYSTNSRLNQWTIPLELADGVDIFILLLQPGLLGRVSTQAQLMGWGCPGFALGSLPFPSLASPTARPEIQLTTVSTSCRLNSTKVSKTA